MSCLKAEAAIPGQRYIGKIGYPDWGNSLALLDLEVKLVSKRPMSITLVVKRIRNRWQVILRIQFN
ncbi:hypothetical protein B5P45_11000 [Phyllobacterium zundukense]|uniref:Uncharacterized protein n=1 Tax=Phyllobacterium zundukense TaxID=1867719 RepID=A0A2N9VZG9_9HYPH|nr:hypothetical protein BLM14_03820 [Phyllobacterium zundukense]PIO44887.1 hypothetical protein B5P45_11000 [Phyllobacterium zundukense]